MSFLNDAGITRVNGKMTAWTRRDSITEQDMLGMTVEEFLAFTGHEQFILLDVLLSMSCNQSDHVGNGKYRRGVGGRKRKPFDAKHTLFREAIGVGIRR